MSSMATDTKSRILDAAEQLFADYGFPATSMRDITNEADVNLAAVNYHFGSKEALRIAVGERTAAPINRDRLERLDELERKAGGSAVSVEALVRAFLAPMFERWSLGKSEPKILKLVGRIHAEVDQDLRAKFIRQFDAVFARYSTAFQRSLPEVPAGDVHWRMLFLVGSMAHTMTWAASIIGTDPRARREPGEILEALVRFAADGMSAPAPKPVAMPAGGAR